MNGALEENETTDSPNGRQTQVDGHEGDEPGGHDADARPVSRSHARNRSSRPTAGAGCRRRPRWRRRAARAPGGSSRPPRSG